MKEEQESGSEIREWVVSVPDPSGTRLDRFIRERLPRLNRRSLGELFAGGRIRVNRQPAVKGSQLRNGDRITLVLPDPPPWLPLADPTFDLSIIYEDRDLIVVDKPGGIPCHPLRAGEKGTLVNALAARYPDLVEAGPNPLEAGLVQRLDNGTSGLLVAGRTRRTWDRLHRDLTRGLWEKRYLALVHGDLDAERVLTDPLAHHPRDRRKMVRVDSNDPPHRGRVREAETRIRPLSRRYGYTLIEVYLVTGVRHQIRVHLAGIGHPLAGDPLYGANPYLPGESVPGRIFLHAHLLRLHHPRTGALLTITSPLPDDLRKILEKLDNG